MNCIICHGNKIEKKEIYEEIKKGNDIIYIPVKIPVCSTCGEKYYDRITLQKLEKLEEQKFSDSDYSEIGKVFKLETAI